MKLELKQALVGLFVCSLRQAFNSHLLVLHLNFDLRKLRAQTIHALPGQLHFRLEQVWVVLRAGTAQ